MSMFDKKDHKEQFAKLTCEESIGLLRHDIGHHLLNSIGLCEVVLENYDALIQDETKLKEFVKTALKQTFKKSARNIICIY